MAQGSMCPSSLCPGQEAGWHSVGIALPCIGPETLTYRFQTNSQLLSAQGTARAHRRAFRNIYTRPSLHCPGEGQRTLGMTPPPLRLVLRWRQLGPAVPRPTLVLWTSGRSLLSPVPRSLPSPTRLTAPNTVQYSNLGFCPPAPSPVPPCLMLD